MKGKWGVEGCSDARWWQEKEGGGVEGGNAKGPGKSQASAQIPVAVCKRLSQPVSGSKRGRAGGRDYTSFDSSTLKKASSMSTSGLGPTHDCTRRKESRAFLSASLVCTACVHGSFCPRCQNTFSALYLVTCRHALTRTARRCPIHEKIQTSTTDESTAGVMCCDNRFLSVCVCVCVCVCVFVESTMQSTACVHVCNHTTDE